MTCNYSDSFCICSFLDEILINVTKYDPLVLECQGRSVSWSSHNSVGNSTILNTKPNSHGIQTSWLVYENATQSDSYILCSRSGQLTTFYNIKVFGKSEYSEHTLMLCYGLESLSHSQFPGS